MERGTRDVRNPESSDASIRMPTRLQRALRPRLAWIWRHHVERDQTDRRARREADANHARREGSLPALWIAWRESTGNSDDRSIGKPRSQSSRSTCVDTSPPTSRRPSALSARSARRASRDCRSSAWSARRSTQPSTAKATNTPSTITLNSAKSRPTKDGPRGPVMPHHARWSCVPAPGLSLSDPVTDPPTDTG
jgi:hypothetical protein